MGSMVVAHRGGIVTRVRLAMARGALWACWQVCYGMMSVLLRPEHPFRVWLKGSRATMMRTQLDALHSSAGPRLTSRGRWKFTAIVLTVTVVFVRDGVNVTGINLADLIPL